MVGGEIDLGFKVEKSMAHLGGGYAETDGGQHQRQKMKDVGR